MGYEATDRFRVMSRFSHLEFGDQRQEPRQTEEVLKDEAHYLAEAQALYEAGHFEQGLRAYARAIEQAPGNVAGWTGQVRMLIELGELRDAGLWADKALERFSTDPELLAAKAVVLARSGDMDAAMAFSDAAIQEHGNTPFVWLARGDVLLARRERRAETCFARALDLAPGNWFVLWLASRIHAFHEQFANSLKLAQQALEANALRAVVWLQMGRCQLALGLVTVARHSLLQARQLDPGCDGLDQAIARTRDSGWGTRIRGLWRQLMGS
jgi:tetratricopeptide (TPR) repeat protein